MVCEKENQKKKEMEKMKRSRRRIYRGSIYKEMPETTEEHDGL